MKLIILTCTLQFFGVITCDFHNLTTNITDHSKDMYVINAMVYQVGILTNKTDDNVTMGNQEALTFFHNNGSKMDFSDIPAPLLTNVTAQSIVQVAPKLTGKTEKTPITWSSLKNFAALPRSLPAVKSETSGIRAARHSSLIGSEQLQDSHTVYYDDFPHEDAIYKRSVADGIKSLMKRETSEVIPSIKTVKTAVVPPSVEVNSIALPPLLTLNKNFSNIPVPIPNTSVVHYEKINTLIRKP